MPRYKVMILRVLCLAVSQASSSSKSVHATNAAPVAVPVTSPEVNQIFAGQTKAVELKEVLMNPLENVRAAVSTGGEVRIEVE